MIVPLKILAKHAAGDNAYIYERILNENSSTDINMLNNLTLIFNHWYVVNLFCSSICYKINAFREKSVMLNWCNYKMQGPKDEFLQPCHVGLELNDGDDPNTTSPKWKPTFSSHGLIAISKHYIVALHCTINISSLIYYSSIKCY